MSLTHKNGLQTLRARVESPISALDPPTPHLSEVRPGPGLNDLEQYMDFTGRYVIAAPPEKVWEGINDPAVLKACIPGCEQLDKTSPTDFVATARLKIGPLSASFKGKVQLTELDPPLSLRLSGEGAGGVAGFAKGGAQVVLTPE